MAAFHVQKVYYVTRHDYIALVGRIESGRVEGGMAIDLPRAIQGPGWVPISGVQTIPFEDGTERLAVILEYEVVVGAPLMEFSALEGLTLDVRSGPS